MTLDSTKGLGVKEMMEITVIPAQVVNFCSCGFMDFHDVFHGPTDVKLMS